MFSSVSYAQTDTVIGKNISFNSDYKTLTARVCSGADNDKDKANAIFNWVTTHIAFDIELSKDPNRETETPKSVLHRRSATSDGYCTLYTEMCREAGLNAITVDGYAREYIEDNNDPHYTISYSWCAVKINDLWYLIDPVRGAGGIAGYTPWLSRQMRKLSKEKLRYDKRERFEFSYDARYFMADPLAFRKDAVPAYPAWQMTTTTLPLNIFEESADAVTSFNAQQGVLVQDNPKFQYLSQLSNEDIILNTADAIYAYNNRNKAIKGAKLFIQAGKLLAQKPGIANLTEAKAKYTEALSYYKEQKLLMPDYYAAMDKKNDDKNREALEYIRQIQMSDRLQMSKCDRYSRTSLSKNELIDKKNKNAHEPVTILLRMAKTSKIKKTDAPEVRKLADSFYVRDERRTLLAVPIQLLKDSIMLTEQKHSNNLEQIRDLEARSANLLSQEATYRIKLRDQYDNEISPLIPKYKEARFAQLDTLMRIYFDEHDYINKLYDELESAHDELVSMIEKMIKDAATWKAWTNSDDGLAQQYDRIIDIYRETLRGYTETMNRHKAHNTSAQGYFKDIKTYFEDEKDLTEDMETAEHTRHEREDKKLKEKKSFHEGLNKRQQKEITDQLKAIDDFLRKNS